MLTIGFILATNETDVQWYKPLSFGYLKSYLEEHLLNEVEMKYLDNYDNVDVFDIIGISSTSQCYDIANEIAANIKLKKSSIITVIGGHHISALPQTLTKNFDIGVIGEGEIIFYNLVKTLLENNLKLSIEIIKNIKGIIYHNINNVIENDINLPVEDLDDLPFPFRHFGVPVHFLTSRGCPFKCSFCRSSSFWGQTRFFSAEYVINEMEFVIKHQPNITQITIWDDLFIANRKRFQEFYNLFISHKLNNKISISFSVRADLVDHELCNSLKNLGVTDVGFGAESGSNRILQLLNKNSTVEINQRAIDILNSYGFTVGCSFIIGSPTETEDEVRSTYEFIIRNKLDKKIKPIVPVNIMMPIPGTKMWDYAVNSGLVDPMKIDWGRLSLFASYRNSNITNLSDWIELRRINKSIYMAEETLPQELLYNLMKYYENIICNM